MKVALWSASPRLGNVAANVETVAKAVLGKEADLVVFPEMFLTGYAIGDDVQRLALRPDDSRLAPLLAACRKAKAHAIVGTPRTPRRGITHNSALLVAPDGAVSWYDKRALATFTTFDEGRHFTRGSSSPVWETPLGRIGIGICYDLYFPEFQKRQVLEGADILVNISASPATSRRFFETLLEARAVENACFSLYSNNVGAQDGIVFWGGARAVGPRGQLLKEVKPYKQGRAVVDLDMDDLRAAREFRPTLRDSDPKDVEAVDRLQRSKPAGRRARRRPRP
ncbi:MAG TPA: carbon-nitrogen hydrolase family protein [Candidatus Thermoplasmatota archaeon]|nr:carbon-nitrogen hydrolase family protein [Candidatus Thermoplasmatota archaeon]